MIQLMLSDLMKAKHNYTRATVRACCLLQGSQHVLNSPILFEETEENASNQTWINVRLDFH